MIPRPALLNRLKQALRRSRIVALIGPRQCGKSTLARLLVDAGDPRTFDLERPSDLARLAHPERTLEPLKGTIVIDEIQRLQSLFPLLRSLADRKPLPAKFLILGSASPALMKQASESLAGRVEFIEMAGFTLDEIKAEPLEKLWLRGGFPLSFLARNLADSLAWRENFIQTFVERDIPQLGLRLPAPALRRFWSMLAHYHAQIWNANEIAASMGVTHPTTRHYLDVLAGAFVIRQLPPWFENVGKRVVKSPKVYFRDSGLLHAFLSIAAHKDLEGHPKLGASWEGFVMEQILRQTGDKDAYFWSTHAGAELDLLLLRRGKKWGIEIKYSDGPELTKSMKIVTEDLGLEKLWVVYPGSKIYALNEKTECLPLKEALRHLARLG